MMLEEFIDNIVDRRIQINSGIEIEEIDYIPLESDTKLEKGKWYSLPKAVAVFADMERSTEISFRRHPRTGAKLYEVFTGSWISILKALDAGYIDIKGDGGFGLFYGSQGVARAIASAVTLQSAIDTRLGYEADRILRGSVKKDEMPDWTLKAKIGIHKGRVLVKRVGERYTSGNRTSWMVWAGKPVNYSAKLSGVAMGGEILASKSVIDTVHGNTELERLYIYRAAVTAKEINRPLPHFGRSLEKIIKYIR